MNHVVPTLRKRVLVFVNSVAEAFRVRLFLEAFGLKVALLNSELPLNSRVHILQVPALSRGFDCL